MKLKALHLLSCGIIGISLFTESAHAQVTNWTAGTPGDWNTAANWDNGIPTSTGTARIQNAGLVNLLGSGSYGLLVLGGDSGEVFITGTMNGGKALIGKTII